ncbi:MAG: nuclear transport factor 2 family protein, partial [Rhodothermaceae bacterium]|nr:nuclear transport factor 2 family protein [Rhodothermaceae bacterium]
MAASDTIQTFYSAFKDGDAARMASLYHDDAEFRDPAFGKLKGSEVKMMWKMLIERSQGNLEIDFTILEVTGSAALVKWEARYPFSQTNRSVHNKITARLT